MRRLEIYLKAALDLLLPRGCIVCGRKLYVREDHLCLYCLSDMPLTRFWTMKHNPMADRFNAVLQHGLEKALEEDECPGCSHERYVYASALFFYDGEASYSHIPHQIKYHGNIPAGRYFGRVLGRKLTEAEWFRDVDLVIPVPLHWRRLWARGYNQAEVIASQVADVLGVPMRTDILKRTRYTVTQTKLGIQEKEKNVGGAFSVVAPPSADAGHILILDDVFTTGSTLHACFEALRAVFPPSVRISIATLAFVGDV